MRAGRPSVLSAFREALSLFDHGLELLHAASAEPAGAGAPAERANLEQLLQIARLVPQRTLGGSGAKELEGALAQVMETGVDDMQDRTKLVALSSECDYMIGRGQLSEVLALSQRILDLAVQCGDAAFEALAHFWFGFAYHLLGEPQQADGYLEWILARCTPGCSGRAPDAWSVSTSCRMRLRFPPSTGCLWDISTRRANAARGRWRPPGSWATSTAWRSRRRSAR